MNQQNRRNYGGSRFNGARSNRNGQYEQPAMPEFYYNSRNQPLNYEFSHVPCNGHIQRMNPLAREFVPSFSSVSNDQCAGLRSGAATYTSADSSNEGCDSLRDRLIEQLKNETYECMICVEKIRRSDRIWSCPQCYHIFHLRCVRKWAQSSQVDSSEQQHENNSGGWRCPGCQFVSDGHSALQYRCFCGRENLTDLASSYGSAGRRGFSDPHACGQPCARQRKAPCRHPCPLQCHAGPCPPCPQIVPKRCACESLKKQVRCGGEPFQCGNACGKHLNCEQHFCAVVCHKAPCEECKEIVEETCFCGQSKRFVSCAIESVINHKLFACDFTCDKQLTCGNHKCVEKCHPSSCSLCPKSPETLKHCPCGKTPLDELSIVPRKNCTDPWPTCEKSCEKLLKCGPQDQRHICKSVCHVGTQCPPCPEKTSVRCRCGAFDGPVPCMELALITDGHSYLCDKRCGKKKNCKIHKCTQICCTDPDHLCMQICGRKLTCGTHTCEQLCHTGKCRPCNIVSFDDLRCFCGESVVYPPVHCGTKPPQCYKKCTRPHACSHVVNHSCHSEPACPPCVFLTQKMCYGGHEIRKNIPCYLDDVSCGKLCGQILPCQLHKCSRVCHKGECLGQPSTTVQQNGGSALNAMCMQPCPKPRPFCGHPCGVPCHMGVDCPLSPCKATVAVTCICGRIKSSAKCLDVAKNRCDADQEILLIKNLPCDEECGRLERNRRLAEALKISRDPHDMSDLAPLYTECLKNGYRGQSDFLIGLEKNFGEIMEHLDTSKSNQLTKTHVFPPMNRTQRQLIHEYAGFYNMDTASYDVEPLRNVVVTATKGKARLPFVLLSSVMMKEFKPMVILQRVAAPTSLNTQKTNCAYSVDDMTNLSLNGNAPCKRSSAQ